MKDMDLLKIRLKRLCLHACTLGFKHPLTKKDVKFSSPLPGIFQSFRY